MNITAIIMIVISTLAAAYCIIQKEVRHCRILDLIITLLGILSNKALYYDQPLSDIMSDLEKEEQYKNLPLVYNFRRNTDEGISVPEAWEKAAVSMCRELNSDECSILAHYGEAMCRCNKEDIPEITSRTLAEFQEYRQCAVEKRNLRSKTTAAVTVSAGIVFVIMFV